MTCMVHEAMAIPIITVIVPLHNEEKYIDRLMESLQAQTHRRLQIILIDGGSTDQTLARMDAWASKWNVGPDSNMGIVEIIRTADNGVSASRNIGLNHASGSLVTFVDGDDHLEKDALARMYACMCETGADMVGMDFEIVYPEGCEPPEDRPAGNEPGRPGETGNAAESVSAGKAEDEVEVMNGQEFLSTHVLGGDVHVWGRLFVTEKIGKLRFLEGLTIGEDMLFVSGYAAKCDRIAHLHYRGYKYLRNPMGAMGRPFTASAMDQVRCFRLEKEFLQDAAPDLADSDALRANMLISVMLTAGRIAFLDKEVRNDEEHAGYVKELRSTIREFKSRGAMKRLDRNYRTKVRIFRTFPALYMAVYHTHRPK